MLIEGGKERKMNGELATANQLIVCGGGQAETKSCANRARYNNNKNTTSLRYIASNILGIWVSMENTPHAYLRKYNFFFLAEW